MRRVPGCGEPQWTGGLFGEIAGAGAMLAPAARSRAEGVLTEPHGPRPDSFYKVDGPLIYVSRPFLIIH
jgi:hypothetical protein